MVKHKHCCETMQYWAAYECDDHPDPTDCPDNIISYYIHDETKSYGIYIKDGENSSIAISYCPWCGTEFNK